MAALQLIRPTPAPTRAVARPRVPPDEGGAWAVVARALDGRDGAATSGDAEVQAAVRAMVAQLKASGLAPERALVLMKGLAQGALATRAEPLSGTEHAARMARITTWSIEAYYGSPS